MSKILFTLLVLFSITLHAAPSHMDIAALREEAFQQCQSPYVPFVLTAVPALDPPKTGGATEEGLVYQEELSITSKTILDQNFFYALAKPRAALNTIPMDVFISNDTGKTYELKAWADTQPDYSSGVIQPPIDKNALPDAGRVLTEIIVGHRSPAGDYPQLFDIRSSGYLRFAGYPPAITGASLRVAAHRIFGFGLHENKGGEDFPIIRKIYISILDETTAHAYMLVDSELFCGAVSLDMIEGQNAAMVSDGYWYTRKNFSWKSSPHTGFVAYSSMLWKTEHHTPWWNTDEAHDSDVLRVYYPTLPEQEYRLLPPENGIAVKEFYQGSETPNAWILANEDRDPYHYQDFLSALSTTNYNFRASYKVEILESSIKTHVAMYEEATGAEYADNLVAASVLREDIKKARSAKDFVRFKYRTTAFY